MAAPNTPGAASEYFADLKTILTGAAAAVAAVLGLFNSVLAELVPPTEDKALTIGWLSLGAVVCLVALSVILRMLKGRAVLLCAALASLACMSASFAAYSHYIADLRTYTFRVPPPPSEPSQRHVRGDLHAQGQQRLQGSSVDLYATKVGVQTVLHTDLLWDAASRHRVVSRLDAWYFAISLLMLCSIFLSAISLRLLLPSGKSPQRGASP